MLKISMQERLFLKKLLTPLRQNQTPPQQTIPISVTLNKLSNPFIQLSKEEYYFIIEKLYDRMEDACDCRNEFEVEQIRSLLHKIKPHLESK